MAEETKKCAHPSCICTVAHDQKYCSMYCEGAANSTEISCGCGHPGCEIS